MEEMSAAPSTAESGSSSLQRSGLSITVGDTKSIVLALQALQSKIRSLEQDRDYHQDQYEAALQAHERYKLDMEHQVEQERVAHRRREAELLELLRKAREERAQLEAALTGNKEDLGGFRRELEQMIASEKEIAQQREATLSGEVARLHADIKDEQTRRAALLVTVDNLKEEREEALATNEHLRVAMDDLLTRYESLQRQQRAPPLQPVRRSSGTADPADARHGALPGGVARQRRGFSSRTRSPRYVPPPFSPVRERRRPAAPAPRQPTASFALHHHYEDPTCNSILRDVRVVPDGGPPCAYPSIHSSMQLPHTPPPPLPHAGAQTARSGRSPRKHSARTPHTSRRQSPSRRAVGPDTADTSALRTTAIEQVEAQLQDELSVLLRRYDDAVKDAATTGSPREATTATQQHIAALVEQKKEQLKLLKEARVELEGAMALGGAHTTGAAADGPAPTSAVHGKHTRRAMLVNELRSLLAEAAEGG
ncbi:hypothetical protein NESM_000034700 [Novymonas esmeraldas]|uniref:Uncharacterized protein n=1 Tax=Novymonas esmeraldas TaxID=1808958 RepID=A0AAW0F0F1_9TRYP